MAEFQPVPISRPPLRSWLPALGSSLAIILALAIVKPWDALGPGEGAVPLASASTGPAAVRSPEPQRERDIYDPRLFGNYEPEPAWELWPAGYVVEFGIAGPVDVRGQESAGPSAGPASASPAAPAPASDPPLPGFVPVVDLGPSDHLIALGVNTPAAVRVTENGVEGKILKIEPLDREPKVQILIDNGLGMPPESLSDLRTGLRGLLEALPPDI